MKKRTYKRHWYCCEWRGDIYMACNFPGGVLVITEDSTPFRPVETQFVPNYHIDHTGDEPKLVEDKAALNRPDAEMKHLRSHVKRLQKASTQDLDDKRVIRAMVDPEGRFKDESLVWIVNWLRSHSRIQPPKKTERGWG